MDPISAGIALAPLAIGAFRRRRKAPNRMAIVNRYRASNPKGYTSPEDEAFAERQRVKANQSARAVGQQRRAQNVHQISARGLTGAAAAALEQGATDVEAIGGEEAARGSADLLYRAFQSNLGYERHKEDAAFAAELGIATQDAARLDAENSSFWNSVMDTTSALAPMLGSVGGGVMSGAEHVGAYQERHPAWDAAPEPPKPRGVYR